MDLIKKITVKTVGFDKTKLQLFAIEREGEGENAPYKLKDGESAPLFRIAGVISDIKPGQSDFGPYVKFVGEFQVVTRTGRQFTSGVALLPSVLSDLVQGKVQQAIERGSSVEFSAEIGLMRDLTSATSYVFTAKPLVEIQPSQRLAALLNASGMPAPDPVPAEKPSIAHDPATGEVHAASAPHPKVNNPAPRAANNGKSARA